MKGPVAWAGTNLTSCIAHTLASFKHKNVFFGGGEFGGDANPLAKEMLFPSPLCFVWARKGFAAGLPAENWLAERDIWETGFVAGCHRGEHLQR